MDASFSQEEILIQNKGLNNNPSFWYEKYKAGLETLLLGTEIAINSSDIGGKVVVCRNLKRNVGFIYKL